MRRVSFLIISALVAVSVRLAVAAPPTSFTYQGSLKQNGAPVNGNFPMEFRVTDAAGTLFWTSGIKVIPVKDGLYKVDLSSPTVDWSAVDPYLELRVNGLLMLPREPISATPYAFLARDLAAGATVKGDLTVNGKLTLGPVNSRIYFNRTPNESVYIGKNSTVGNELVLQHEVEGPTYDVVGLKNQSNSIIGSVNFIKYSKGYPGNDDAGLPLSNSAKFTIGADNISRWTWMTGNNTTNEGLYFEAGSPNRVTTHLTPDGHVRATGGSSPSDPGFSFYGDDDTGMYRPTTNALAFATGGSNRIYINDNGSVGINNPSPSEVLHTGGRVRIEAPVASGNAGGDERFRGALRVIGNRDDSNGRLVVLQAPWGSTYQTDRIYMVGINNAGTQNFIIRGDGGYFASSSRALKDNIMPVAKSLDLVSRISGVRYKWKNDPANTYTMGFIAEDLAKVIPEAVDGGKFVNYNAVVPVLVESIKELKAQLEAVNKQLAQMLAEKER